MTEGEGRGGQQGGAEAVLDELEHQGVVGDLDGRRITAQDALNSGADAPAGRELQDRLPGQVRDRHA